MLELNAKTTALVVIDLQEGILPFAGGPHTADEVVNRAGKLAAKFRASGQPVFLVRVGWSMRPHRLKCCPKIGGNILLH